MDFLDLAVGPAPQLPRAAFEKRRARIAKQLGEGKVLAVATHAETVHSNDVHHSFRPHSDFWYLTGFAEPESVLLLQGNGETTLFLRPRKPEAEVWTGRRLGLERAPDVLGVDRVESFEDLAAGLLKFPEGPIEAIASHHPAVLETLKNTGRAIGDGRELLAEARLRKDAAELELMQKAADVAIAGHRAAAELVQPGRREFEIEAAFTHAIRAAGSTGNGYPPIVGTGANAAILHYVDNRSTVQDGDLVLIDAGCEWGYYNSDITRTWPAGNASSRALELHALVQQAHKAGIAQVRPGKRFRDPHDAAVRVLVDGLVDMGVLSGDKDKLIESNEHRKFFMHGTSHFLGLDVHDVGKHKDGDTSRELEEGMVLTVEPGLYFNPDFAACPQGYAGIGIRIEDDIAVGADGPRNLTQALGCAPESLLAGVR